MNHYKLAVLTFAAAESRQDGAFGHTLQREVRLQFVHAPHYH